MYIVLGARMQNSEESSQAKISQQSSSNSVNLQLCRFSNNKNDSTVGEISEMRCVRPASNVAEVLVGTSMWYLYWGRPCASPSPNFIFAVHSPPKRPHDKRTPR